MNRDFVLDMGYEDAIFFGNQEYDDAIIGVSDDGRVVYDYEKMVDGLVSHDGMTYEEAEEFIGYNTIRAIPYAGDKAPIVMYKLPREENYQ